MNLSKALWALLLIGLAVRVGYGSRVILAGISHPSMDEYETIARQLVDHGRFQFAPGKPTAAREPAYPLFIAGLYLLFGKHPLLVILAHALLGAWTCLLIRALTARLFGGRAGDAAFAVSLFYPYFIFYTGYFYRETFLCWAVSLALYLLSLMLERPDGRRAAAAGLATGLCAATLSSWIPICGAIGLWAVWRAASKGLPKKSLLVFLACAALLPSLWALRNAAVFHRLIPGSTLGGFNFYTALIVPEEFRGSSREYEFEAADPHWRRLMDMSDIMVDDGSQQAAFFAQAVEWIKAHPGRYLAHCWHQAVKLWRLYPYPRAYQHSFGLIKALSLASDGWLIPLGFFGLILHRRKPEVALFGVLLGAGTLTYAAFSAIVRYRLPMMIPLIILCAPALVAGYDRLRAR